MKSTLSIKALLAASGVLALLATAATLLGNEYLALLIGLPAYLVLPGLLIQLALSSKVVARLNTFLYSVGLSLFFWIIGGLGLNTLLPHVGINRPLSLTYILPLYLFTIALLSVVTYLRHRPGSEETQLTLPESSPLSSRTKLAVGVAVALPVLSVLGANTLNNGGTGVITMTMLIGLCAYVVFLATNLQKVHRFVYPLAIFGSGLALLLMYSMRSWHVLGWDINDELRVFNATLSAARWKMSTYPGQSYNACLSITILPAITARLFHLSAAYTFKFLYQVLFAVVPVAVYSIARRFLLPILALTASLLFVAQNWFYELMPALARQEIAIIFFALFLLTLTDNAISTAYKRTLLYVTVAGLVLSHYSTAYIWLILCAIAYLMLLAVRLLSRTARHSPKGLTLPLILFGAALMYVWQVPLTTSSATASTVAANLGPQLANAFSPSVAEQAFDSAFVGPPSESLRTITAAYNAAVKDRLGSKNQYYPPSKTGSYRPTVTDPTGHAPDDLPGPVTGFIALIEVATKALVDNVMTALGVLLIGVYFIRRGHKSNLDLIALSAAGYVLILAALLVPYLGQVYNLTRLGLQVFVLLVVPATAALWVVVRRNVRFGLPIIGVIVAILLASQSGLVDQFTGGNVRTTMSPSGGNTQPYYETSSEIYAAQWLSRNRAPQVPIFADQVADLRLRSYGNIDAAGFNIFPSTIPVKSLVYLDSENVNQGVSFSELANVSLTYNTPTTFLNQNKNLVYSSGGSEIYR